MAIWFATSIVSCAERIPDVDAKEARRKVFRSHKVEAIQRDAARSKKTNFNHNRRKEQRLPKESKQKLHNNKRGTKRQTPTAAPASKDHGQPQPPRGREIEQRG